MYDNEILEFGAKFFFIATFLVNSFYFFWIFLLVSV